MSKSQVTITLGRSGQVVKRPGPISDSSQPDYLQSSGSKRSIKERLGSNVDRPAYGNQPKNKRQRGVGNKSSFSVDDMDAAGVSQDDLRFKLMSKKMSRRTWSASGEPTTDLRAKLSRKVDPPVRTDIQQGMSEPNTADCLRQVHQRMPEPSSTSHLGQVHQRMSGPNSTNHLGQFHQRIPEPNSTNHLRHVQDRIPEPNSTSHLRQVQQRMPEPNSTRHSRQVQQRMPELNSTSHLRQDQQRMPESNSTSHLRQDQQRMPEPNSTSHLRQVQQRMPEPNSTSHLMQVQQRIPEPNSTSHFSQVQQRMPGPDITNHSRQVPPSWSAEDMHHMDSMRKSYSPWTMDGMRGRSPDGDLGTSRCLSPPRAMDGLRQDPSVMPVDPSRSTFLMNRDVLDASIPTSLTGKATVPFEAAKLVVRYPPTSGRSIMQNTPYTGEEPLTVASLLHSLGLGKYAILFQAEEVDIAALKQMRDTDLKELGIPMGPRKKILLAVMPRARRQP